MNLRNLLLGEPLKLERVQFSSPFEGDETPLGITWDEQWNDHYGVTPHGIAALFRGTQFIADVVAQFPIREVNERGQSSTPMLLEQPDPSITLQETLHEILMELLWTGNAFVWVRGKLPGRYAESIYLIPTEQITVQWDRQQMYRVYHWYRPDGTVLKLTPGKDLLHISLNRRRHDLMGKGPIQGAPNLLAAVAAQEDMYKRLFQEDARIPYVIKVHRELSDRQAESILDRFEGRHKARRRGAVIDIDADIQTLSQTMEGAQAIETARHGVRQIATLLGLDAFLLNEESGGSGVYENVNGMYFRLMRETIQPTYLERLEAHFSLLLPPGKRAKFDTSSMLELDETRRIQNLNLMSWMTQNEKREREGLPPLVDENDKVSSNDEQDTFIQP